MALRQNQRRGSVSALGPLQRDQWAIEAGQARKLTPTQRFVLSRVAAAANGATLESWRSVAHYVNETGFGRRAVGHAVEALINHGLLLDKGTRARKRLLVLAIPVGWTCAPGAQDAAPPAHEVREYIGTTCAGSRAPRAHNPSSNPSTYPSSSSEPINEPPVDNPQDDDDLASESEHDEHGAIIAAVCGQLAQHDLDQRPDHLDPVATPDRWLKATATRRANAHRIEIGAAIACGVTNPTELVEAILANEAPAQAVNGTPRPATVPWAESTNPAVVAERRRLQAVPDLAADEPILTIEQSQERIRQAKETLKR